MKSRRVSSIPSSAAIGRAIEAYVPEPRRETVFSVAQGHDFDDAPEGEDGPQPWIVSSLTGLSIVVPAGQAGAESVELALFRPWTDAVSARSLPQQGVIEITWTDGTTTGLVISDKSRRRRRGLGLSIKEQIQGSIIVSERHVIAGHEVLVAVRRAEFTESFSQVIGGHPALLQNKDVAAEINAIESKLRSMCGLAP